MQLIAGHVLYDLALPLTDESSGYYDQCRAALQGILYKIYRAASKAHYKNEKFESTSYTKGTHNLHLFGFQWERLWRTQSE